MFYECIGALFQQFYACRLFFFPFISPVVLLPFVCLFYPFFKSYHAYLPCVSRKIARHIRDNSNFNRRMENNRLYKWLLLQFKCLCIYLLLFLVWDHFCVVQSAHNVHHMLYTWILNILKRKINNEFWLFVHLWIPSQWVRHKISCENRIGCRRTTTLFNNLFLMFRFRQSVNNL